VTVREVGERYKAVWSPGMFWPRDAFMHTKKTSTGSPLFAVVWSFLTGWFICVAFYLIVAGSVPAIEVFRAEAHFRAAMFVSAALCLAAVWPVLFRTGSYVYAPPSEKGGNTNVNQNVNNQVNQQVTQVNNIIDMSWLAQLLGGEAADAAPAGAKSTKIGDINLDSAVENNVSANVGLIASSHSATKQFFLWVSFFVLLLASCLAVAGSGVIQAWTLPGPQFGTLLFLGPGYGLFAGWLLFAAALNLSIAISYSSYPSGTLPWPETRTRYTHRGSLWPPAIALVVAAIAVLVPDPAIPLPMFIAIFLFTPRQKTHLAASLICLLGVVVATVIVVLERSD